MLLQSVLVQIRLVARISKLKLKASGVHQRLHSVPETGLEPARDCSRQPLKLACLQSPDIPLALMYSSKFLKKLGLQRISHLTILYSHIGRIANIFTKFLPNQARETK